MKVRLTTDMLRLRLDQSDVDALTSSGSVAFGLPLSNGTLRCMLRMDAAADVLTASLTERAITVILPASQARRWIVSDAVSLEGQIDGDATPTRILVEKDLGCRHTDDAPDAAANPQMFDHLRDASGTKAGTEAGTETTTESV